MERWVEQAVAKMMHPCKDITAIKVKVLDAKLARQIEQLRDGDEIAIATAIINSVVVGVMEQFAVVYQNVNTEKLFWIHSTTLMQHIAKRIAEADPKVTYNEALNEVRDMLNLIPQLFTK